MITFYRCLLCATVVSKWDIKNGEGCPKCGGKKVAPTNMSLWEKFVQILKHPNVWGWGEDNEYTRAEFPGERDE